MKAVLMSIQPKWCELIASGKKTIEVRRTRPKLETPFKCYIYETKGLCDTPTFIDECGYTSYRGRGQVIGEFVCDRIDNYECYNELPYDKYNLSKRALDNMCLICHDVDKYGAGKPLYGWHISDLKIYDKPKELGEFKRWNKSFKNDRLTSPPQNWCYVEDLEV